MRTEITHYSITEILLGSALAFLVGFWIGLIVGELATWAA